jgi:hypothetical protein
MRAGISIRVSSEDQVDGFSFDAQRRILLEHGRVSGWDVANAYADEGTSAHGDAIAKRPAFKQMMGAVEAGCLIWWPCTHWTASRATSSPPQQHTLGGESSPCRLPTPASDV